MFLNSILHPLRGAIQLCDRTDVDVGIRFFGANVAEMWVTDIWLGHWREAGIELRGYSVRTARNASAKGTPCVPFVGGFQSPTYNQTFISSSPFVASFPSPWYL
jgi:hypothetical protein